MASKPQSAANHTRIVPGFHVVAFALVVINLIWSAQRLIRNPSGDNVVSFLVAILLLLLLAYTRQFAITVQDRVIRLETRLRLERALPPEWRARIAELSLSQLIALRFAGDEELAALTQRVLTEKIEDRAAIKRLIQHWQADNLRA